MRAILFHAICTTLTSLGKQFQDAKLLELCIESGVIAECAIARDMAGRRYTRTVPTPIAQARVRGIRKTTSFAPGA